MQQKPTESQERVSVLAGIVQAANPVFIIIVICLPTAAVVYAINWGSLTILNYVHVLFGGFWTGIDLFMGFILGPVLRTMQPKDRAELFKRLVPRMTFLMPVLAGVTITAGFQLIGRLGYPLDNPRIIAALVITGILTLQGFGVLLPNEISMFRQLLSPRPDVNKISRLGMRNAALGGIQGIFQLAIIFDMAVLRF